MNEPFSDTEKEELSEETVIRQMIDGITDCLASMTKEERIAWFRRSQYPHPLNFQKEIDGTVYTVNAHLTLLIQEHRGKEREDFTKTMIAKTKV